MAVGCRDWGTSLPHLADFDGTVQAHESPRSRPLWKRAEKTVSGISSTMLFSASDGDTIRAKVAQVNGERSGDSTKAPHPDDMVSHLPTASELEDGLG